MDIARPAATSLDLTINMIKIKFNLILYSKYIAYEIDNNLDNWLNG